MAFAGKWKELELIMFSEIAETQKEKESCFLSYVEPRFTCNLNI